MKLCPRLVVNFVRRDSQENIVATSNLQGDTSTGAPGMHKASIREIVSESTDQYSKTTMDRDIQIKHLA